MTPAELKEARQSLGLSQSQLGLMLGYALTPHTRQKVAKMEAGSKPIQETHRRLIAAYLAGYRPKDWPGIDRHGLPREWVG